MITETDFNRLMLDAQGEPHLLAVLLETTRAELLEACCLLSSTRKDLAALVEQKGAMEKELQDQIELREHAIEFNAGRAKLWHSRFHVLASGVQPFIDDWLATYQRFADAALTAEAVQMRRNAAELLDLIDRDHQ